MTSTESVEKKVRSVKIFLEGLHAVDNGGVLVAFSGGPDSTALLFSLAECVAGASCRIGIAYYNHRLRGDEQASSESLHVAEKAAELHLQLYSGEAARGEIRAFADDHKLSTEEAARVLRYRFLRSTAEINGYRFIATGHTGDDVVETLIQRFFQGSGVWGLCGIRRVAGMLIRPILEWNRDDVNAYIASRSLTAFVDPSNCETVYLRNYIRHSIVPVVRTAFPEFKNSLGTLALKMATARDYLDESISAAVYWKKQGDSFMLPLLRFVSLHSIERIESVRRLLDEAHEKQPGTLRIPFRAFSRLMTLPALHDNTVLFRGWGYRLQVHGDGVFLEPDVVFGKGKGYFKVVNECEGAQWSTCLPAVEVRMRKTAGSHEMSLPLEHLSFPLIVRSRKEGDVIRTGAASKDLKKLYNQWRVPEYSRWMIPVCEDRTGIVAVFGGLFGFENLERCQSSPRRESASLIFEKC